MPPKGRAVRAVPTPPPSGFAAKVRETLAALETKLQPEDAALAELAVRYAETIDVSADLAAAAEAIPYDPDTVAMVQRLKVRVDAHQVMVDVGPKLQAALDALGATPKARATAGKPPPPGGKSALASLRGGDAA